MSAENYIENVYLRQIALKSFDQTVGEGWSPEDIVIQRFREALPATLEKYGYRPAHGYEELVKNVIKGLIDRNGIVFEGDAYTGRYARLVPANKALVVKSALQNNPVTSRISQLGPPALQRAIDVIAKEEGWYPIAEQDSQSNSSELVEPEAEQEQMQIPASDRIVTLGHNQSESLASATDELILTLENTTNSIDGDTSLRARILGQLKAAKELLLSGIFKLHALQVTLVESLEFLAKRYEKEAIGALAAALLTELLKVLGG